MSPSATPPRTAAALPPGATFRPAGALLWDPWFVRRGKEHHVFYLRVPVLDDPEARHHAGVQIGHAVSLDLLTWTERPAALGPGIPPAWDSLALWTGCVVEDGGAYHHFYTGRREHEFWLQRIGVATSGDLDAWAKDGSFLLEADPRWYSPTGDLNELGVPPAWRDPWVFRDPAGGEWCMTVSARTASGGPHNACVALLRSDDLRRWRAQPPLLAPGRYDEMEATQVVFHEGRCYLFFSTWAVHYRPDWASEHGGGESGLHCYVADGLDGEFVPVNGSGVVLPDGRNRYTVRLVDRDSMQGAYRAVGWLNYDADDRFIGALSAPELIVIDGDEVRVAGRSA